MFRGSTLVFDKLLEKATSSLRLDPDWPSIMQICDLIRQNDCTPRYAVTAIKKKLNSQNPHQAMFGVLVLESIVKNCGSGVHDEIAAKPNCEVFRDFIKSTPHETVRNKMLELIQAWAFAFRNKSKYRAVQDTVNIMKTEGYKFPALKESDAMFSADTAPDWSDGNVCHRCRVAFTMMQRKHHCRACGQVFCGQCSSKTTTLPKFGIEKEVRVCDACFDLENRPPGPKSLTDTSEAAEFTGSSAPGSQNPPRKTAEELQEEEELQLALALSQSEAEQKEKEKERKRISTSAPSVRAATPPTPPVSSAPPQSQSVELSRYLDRDYWERRASSAAPTINTATSLDNSKVARAISPPVKTNISIAPMTNVNAVMNNKMSVLQLDDNCADVELEEFVAALKSQVEIFVNRMKSNSSRGRSIANDTSVQTLFMNITAMHSRLLRYIQQQDDARVHYEGLQDKLSQVRDSRAALDVLREEHAERMRRAAEAAERQRQMQMAYKLDVMRKKKHEYLQYQRQLALQRIQEQERELQMRQEQQKHQYMMGANAPYFPQNGPARQFHPVQPGYPPAPFAGQPFPQQQMVPSSGSDAAMAQTLPNQQNPGMAMMAPHLQGMAVGAGQMVPGMMLGSNALPRSMPPNGQMQPMRHPSPQMMNQPGQPMIRPPTSQPHQLPPHQIPPHQIPPQQMPPQQLQRQMPPQQMPQQHMPPQQQQQGIPMQQHKMPQMMPQHQHPQQQMHGGPPQMPPMQQQPPQMPPIQQPTNPPAQDANPPPPQITQSEPAPSLPNSPPANQTAELISFD